MSGPNPFTFSDIAAWAKLTGTIIRREEIAIIRQMDAAYRNALADEQEAQRERGK